MLSTKKGLSPDQVKFYEENGYLFPLPVLSSLETAEFRRDFDNYTAENQERLKGLIPRERRTVFALTHLVEPWVYRIASHPRVLDAVEGVIGPDIMVWESTWFIKFPRDPAFISWHQDGAYWGLTPPQVTTAWIALSASTPENGCLEVMPGTHAVDLPQRDTYAKNNALSRGQEIALDMDGTKAVSLSLSPGEMSLHHIGIAHGSKANSSDQPRIGIAIRYIAPEVVQNGPARQIVQLVRGKDDYGHFDLTGPPEDPISARAVRAEADKRLLANILADAKPAN